LSCANAEAVGEAVNNSDATPSMASASRAGLTTAEATSLIIASSPQSSSIHVVGAVSAKPMFAALALNAD
jgi:hypothetical protein